MRVSPSSMPLRFYNTLTQQVEEFQPALDNTVRMYTCGPTVYDYAHIGNFRSFAFVDLLRRWLRASGFALDHVMNITDVDDKIIRNAVAQRKNLREYTAIYTQKFLEDCDNLRLERPEHLTPATEHIDEMVSAIQRLTETGHTYTSDGSTYYRISTFPEYGKLSHNDFSGNIAGARVDVDEYEKADARDFALWKAPKEGEPAWETPIGPGRPGLAHRVLRHGHRVPRRDARYPRRRRRPDLPAPRKRDRAVGGAHRQAVCALLAARRVPDGGRPEDVEVAGQLLSPCATSSTGATRPRPSATCWLSVPYRKQLNFTFDGLKSAATAIERLRNFQAAAGDRPLRRRARPGHGRARPRRHPRRSSKA